MESRPLGRTGRRTSVLVYGAAALAAVTQDVADASVALALDAGIDHIDTAASYGDAELRLGALMSGIRDRVFLATKTGERTAEAAYRQIVASLERLRTDRVDLLQLHAVGTLGELDRVTAPGGALAAAVRAQEEGLVGAVGITGHGHDAPATHLAALDRYPFATVLTPLNVALAADPAYLADYDRLAAACTRSGVALRLIKTVARRNWPGTPTATTWYEPLTDPERIRAAVSWALARPEVAGIATPGDVRLLPLVVAAERDRMDPAEAARLLTADPELSSPFRNAPAWL